MDRVTAGYQGMVTRLFLHYHDDDEANEQGDAEKREYDHVRLLSASRFWGFGAEKNAVLSAVTWFPLSHFSRD